LRIKYLWALGSVGRAHDVREGSAAGSQRRKLNRHIFIWTQEEKKKKEQEMGGDYKPHSPPPKMKLRRNA
jgi:hypothetical protein